MLEIDGLSRHFGTKVAVADVSLQIENGAFVGIIGWSGAGKSTLLRVINRLVEPTGGRIVFDGLDVTALRGREFAAGAPGRRCRVWWRAGDATSARAAMRNDRRGSRRRRRADQRCTAA